MSPPPMKKTSIEIPTDLWMASKTCAIYQNRDLRNVIIDALVEYIGRHRFEMATIEKQNIVELLSMPVLR